MLRDEIGTPYVAACVAQLFGAGACGVDKDVVVAWPVSDHSGVSRTTHLMRGVAEAAGRYNVEAFSYMTTDKQREIVAQLVGQASE